MSFLIVDPEHQVIAEYDTRDEAVKYLGPDATLLEAVPSPWATRPERTLEPIWFGPSHRGFLVSMGPRVNPPRLW